MARDLLRFVDPLGFEQIEDHHGDWAPRGSDRPGDRRRPRCDPGDELPALVRRRDTGTHGPGVGADLGGGRGMRHEVVIPTGVSRSSVVRREHGDRAVSDAPIREWRYALRA
jgi:hypothetical protein